MIAKLATNYSNQGNIDGRWIIFVITYYLYVNTYFMFVGVLKCNEQLREIDSGYALVCYSNLVYAYKVQGKEIIFMVRFATFLVFLFLRIKAFLLH